MGSNFESLKDQGFEVRDIEVLGHDLDEPRANVAKQGS